MTTVSGGRNRRPSNTRTFVTAVLGATLPIGVSSRLFLYMPARTRCSPAAVSMSLLLATGNVCVQVIRARRAAGRVE